MNKLARNIFLFCLIAFGLGSCTKETLTENFGVDTSEFELGPEGGTRTFKISSGDGWYASTTATWITVSPANGKGSAECSIIVDSALTTTERSAKVQIASIADSELYEEFDVYQEGFSYTILPSEVEISVADYAALGSRSFDVVVNTNVDFTVDIPAEANWLTTSKSGLVLDKGVRPRNVTLHFEWRINTQPSERVATISLTPVEDVDCDAVALKVVQLAAEEIEIGVAGDSLALLAINRNLGCWSEYNTSERMRFWNMVDVWDEYDDNYEEANAAHLEKYGTKIDGRVRYVKFYIFSTKEGIPYEVQYLTAAEEIIFFSNTNAFLYSLDPGEYITLLPQLKRLGIYAYGLTTLPDALVNLENLEALYLDSNNFQEVPSILTPENFPKLKTLTMCDNERYYITNLNLDYRDQCGGLIDDPDWTRLLKWSNLDTLRLSVNYLSGEIPSYEDDWDGEYWTEAEVAACDSLPSRIIGLPKVLPNTNYFTINYNRLHGDLPDWLLYHPKLDQWYPTSLVFQQEGTDRNGIAAKFDNEPTSLNYYYEVYTTKDNPYATE